MADPKIAATLTALAAPAAAGFAFVSAKALMELKGIFHETLENIKKTKLEKNKSLVLKMSRELVSNGMLKLNDSKTINEVDVALQPVLKEIAQKWQGDYDHAFSAHPDSQITEASKCLIRARNAEHWRLETNAAGYDSLAQLLIALDGNRDVAQKYSFKQRDHSSIALPKNISAADIAMIPKNIVPEDLTVNEEGRVGLARNTDGKWDMDSLAAYFHEHKSLPPEFAGWEKDTQFPKNTLYDASAIHDVLCSAKFMETGEGSFGGYVPAFYPSRSDDIRELLRTMGESLDGVPLAERTPEIIANAATMAQEQIVQRQQDAWDSIVSNQLTGKEIEEKLQQGYTMAHMTAQGFQRSAWEDKPHPDWETLGETGGPKKPGGPKM